MSDKCDTVARIDEVKKLIKCANEIPSNGIFGSEDWSSFICLLQRHEDDGELSGDTQDFNAVARHLNQLSEGNGYTIIKNEYKLRYHFHP